MASPFPGMDPYLEGPSWFGFHHFLISKTVEHLQKDLRARGYFATPGERVWLAQPERPVYPDVAMLKFERRGKRRGHVAVLESDEPIFIERAVVEVREPFVEIYDLSGHRLVTGIEFVSPTNKSDRQGRELYQKKQQETQEAGVHLVEIDLIRRGPHVLDVPEAFLEQLPRWDYLINTCRRNSDRYEVYPVRIRDRLPRIRVPLKEGDEDVVLDVQAVFNRAYQVGVYADRINYKVDPPVPLADDDAAWARQLLKKKGHRK
jgi:hypothetical protein